jgi:putative transposase
MSDGSTEPNSKPLKTALRKLKRLQKANSRKVKGSSNRRKSAKLLARLHLKIANKRKDPLDKLSTKLAKNHGRIVIEDLNVDGMIKNHKLAQAISDVAWGKFRTMLEYKCEWYGSELIVVDRFYPSSKLCSSCGWKDNNLTLTDREFNCLQCGLIMDRDLNAAINLENYPVAVSSMETLNACGGSSVGSPENQEEGIV